MHALSAHAWDYLPALKTVFESVGLDYLYHVNDFNKERFNAFMGQFEIEGRRTEFHNASPNSTRLDCRVRQEYGT
jgi:hypothetical protein